jgi:hypothetical protein
MKAGWRSSSVMSRQPSRLCCGDCRLLRFRRRPRAQPLDPLQHGSQQQPGERAEHTGGEQGRDRARDQQHDQQAHDDERLRDELDRRHQRLAHEQLHGVVGVADQLPGVALQVERVGHGEIALEQPPRQPCAGSLRDTVLHVGLCDDRRPSGDIEDGDEGAHEHRDCILGRRWT